MLCPRTKCLVVIVEVKNFLSCLDDYILSEDKTIFCDSTEVVGYWLMYMGFIQIEFLIFHLLFIIFMF